LVATLRAAPVLAVTAAVASAGAPVPAELVDRASREGAARVIVRLDAPAAPQALAAGGDRAERAHAAIAVARDRLAGDLAATAGWSPVREFRTIPYVVLDAAPAALAALAASPSVLAIGEDRLESISLVESVPIVQADRAHAAGLDGTGWVIAVLDTGVDGGHPFLAGKVVSEACFSGNSSCPNGARTQIGAGSAGPCGYAPNACPHGTHVAGVAAGRGDGIVGVAPDAGIISLQVFSRFTGSVCDDDVEDPCAKTYTSDTIAALERVYELRSDFRIAAANLSFGGGRYFSESECDAQDAARKAVVDNLRAAGIVTISASGNADWTDSTTAPACLTSAIAVGAVDKGDAVAGFSNSAPFLDFLAPGVRIRSSLPGGGFGFISGTSQAAPHVAGAFAILAERLDDANPDVITAALRDTGLFITDPRNSVAVARIQVQAALDSLPAPPARGSGIQVTPDGKRTIVNKDVGAERWAITENADDGSVTGNVFRADGGPASFVFCARLGDDGNPDPFQVLIDYRCSGADACADATCPASTWSPLGDVTLRGSFFEPPPASTTALLPAESGAVGSTADVAAAPAGVQITPDAVRRSLVSKDIAGERWAITRNPDDGTVTGNVFRTDGSDPAFVWCEEVGRNGVDISYGCSGADHCETGPCTPERWSFIGDVTLSEGFFLP
jgi:subtilisin family serine protease